MHLQLVKDNNDWEIHKLKLELLFSCNWLSSRINIQQSHQHLQQHPVLSLLVTQRLHRRYLHPQQWPHVKAPGEARLYADLSLAEFCVAYLVIIQGLGDKPRLDNSVSTLLTTTFSVSVTLALSSLISPLVLVFGLQPWCVIALHLPSPSCIVVLATTVQTSLTTSVKQRFKNSHMMHSVPLAPFSPPRVWIPLLKKNPHLLLLWRS